MHRKTLCPLFSRHIEISTTDYVTVGKKKKKKKKKKKPSTWRNGNGNKLNQHMTPGGGIKQQLSNQNI